MSYSAPGALNPNWRGGRKVAHNGYVLVNVGNAYEREHVLVAERALGKPLPLGAEVHHVNGDRADNRPVNLVICQGRAYHMLLHWRLRVYRAGGRPGLDHICSTCKAVKPLGEFFRAKRYIGVSGRCRDCDRAEKQARRAA